jgi:carboxyl-terminal processing protease
MQGTRSLLINAVAGCLIFLVGWQLGAWHNVGAGYMTIGNSTTGERVRPGLTASGVTVTNPERDVDSSLLWEAWNTLIDNYIEPSKLQVTPLMYGATEGLVRAVGDPYTVYMTPEENKEFDDSLKGNLEGIGAELSMKDQEIIVVSPIKGSPAERAGIKANDIITAVDGVSTADMNLSQVVTRIRGKQGTKVTISIYREKSGAQDVTLTREQIHVPSVEAKIIPSGGKNIGYAALNQFGDDSIAELTQELQSFKAKKVDGIILDLRNNGGGYLDGAVQLTSVFVSEGIVVSVERREGPAEREYVSGHPMLPTIPLVVLQNEATASASEIVAGALQDHDRATIVGKKSFGKGTVQEVLPLRGGGSMRVTVAHWLTPNGKNLSKEGVTPDVAIEPGAPGTETMGTPGKDIQLDTALQVVTGRKTP